MICIQHVLFSKENNPAIACLPLLIRNEQIWTSEARPSLLLAGWRSCWFGCRRTYESGHVSGLVPALCQQLGDVVNTSDFDNIYLRSRASSTPKGPGPASAGTESYYRVYTGSLSNLFCILLSVCHQERLLWCGVLLQFTLLSLELKPAWFPAVRGFVAMPDWFQVPFSGKFPNLWSGVYFRTLTIYISRFKKTKKKRE